MERFNRALLAKWMWKLVVEKSRVWKDVILSKYVKRDNNGRTLKSNAQSRWWRDLCILCEEGSMQSWFHNQMIWKVGK